MNLDCYEQLQQNKESGSVPDLSGNRKNSSQYLPRERRGTDTYLDGYAVNRDLGDYFRVADNPPTKPLLFIHCRCYSPRDD
jgi:hypothetical protein